MKISNTTVVVFKDRKHNRVKSNILSDNGQYFYYHLYNLPQLALLKKTIKLEKIF